MEEFVIFRGSVPTDENGGTLPLSVDALIPAAARCTKMLAFRGSTYCLPLRDSQSSGVGSAMLAVSGAPEEEIASLVKHTAAELGCDIYDGSPEALKKGAPQPFTLGDDDCDLSFLDRMPTIEEEIGAVWLRFTIDELKGRSTESKLIRFCQSKKLDYETEPDGIAIYLSTTVALDLFFDASGQYVDGELDASYAGAGLYADACELANELAKSLGGRLEFLDTDKISYPLDRDFEKLRRHFFAGMKQQLAFAVADDRDGFQAYVGWGVDTYEPEEMPGTVITHLGRYELDRLLDEITTYGFEAVADRRFFIRNTRAHSSDEHVKSALSLLWSQCSELRYKLRPRTEVYIPEHFALEQLGEALDDDPSPQIPLEAYKKLAALVGRSKEPIPKCSLYIPHYPIGYLSSEISYGFGSYLRRFKLHGSLLPGELIQGERVRITDGASVAYDITIEYFDSPAVCDDSFITEIGNDIQVADIGGGSQCRFVVCEQPKFEPARGLIFEARAEIVSRDERYRITLETGKKSELDRFGELISGCRAIEEVDDLPPVHQGEKPRAFGACYFKRATEAQDPEALVTRLNKLLTPTMRPLELISFVYGPATDLNSKLGGRPYMPSGATLPRAVTSPETIAAGVVGKPLDFVLQINFDDLAEPLPGFPEKGILQLFCAGLGKGRYDRTLLKHQRLFTLRWYPEPEESTEVTEQTKLILTTRLAMRMSSEDRRFETLDNATRQAATLLLQTDPVLFEQNFCRRGSWIGGWRTIGTTDACYDSGLELVFQLETSDYELALLISESDLRARDFSKAQLYIDDIPIVDGESE